MLAEEITDVAWHLRLQASVNDFGRCSDFTHLADIAESRKDSSLGRPDIDHAFHQT